MIRLREEWAILVAAYQGFERDEGWMLSGHIAFSALLALFPFLILATATTGYLVGPEQGAAAIDWLFEIAPEGVAEGLVAPVREVLDTDRGGLITVSALAALWAASNGVEAFRLALDRAYSVGAPRGFALRRAIAILFVFVAVVSFAVLAVAILLAPSLIRLAEAFLEIKAPPALGLARYAVGLGVFLVFLFSLHRFLPSRGMGRHRLWPGVTLTTVLWMVAAQSFSVYLANAPSYALTYGALAGVIVALLFLYLTGALIIFGAEYNAAIEAAEAPE